MKGSAKGKKEGREEDGTHGIQIRLSTPHLKMTTALSIAIFAYSRSFGSLRSYS